MAIKAIETRYAGCHFRSRLEARYAVLFDSLGIKWQYEPEGYKLPSGYYLPDFYLPDVFDRQPEPGVWFEVKPYNQQDERWYELSGDANKTVYVGFGLPDPRSYLYEWIEEFTGQWSPYFENYFMSWDNGIVFCNCDDNGVWTMKYGPEGSYHTLSHNGQEYVHERPLREALTAARSARFDRKP